jgi:hypothetical protein
MLVNNKTTRKRAQNWWILWLQIVSTYQEMVYIHEPGRRKNKGFLNARSGISGDASVQVNDEDADAACGQGRQGIDVRTVV